MFFIIIQAYLSMWKSFLADNLRCFIFRDLLIYFFFNEIPIAENFGCWIEGEIEGLFGL